MKELEKHSRETDRIQIEAEVKVKKQVELKYDSTIRPKNGHTLYEINEKTLEVLPASYKENKTVSWKEALDIVEGKANSKEVIKRKGCVYISALNPENALERYKKQKGSAVKEGKGSIKIF